MANLIGFHGKAPSRGDFIQHGLPDSFVEKWDRWLQESIAHSRAAMGDRWLELYLTSPIWRFALAPGVIDDQLWCGAVMPSVDRVNRYFPLTIAASVEVGDSLFDVVGRLQPWFDEVDGLLLQALDNDALDINNFSAMVSSRVLPEQRNSESSCVAPISATGEIQFALGQDSGPGEQLGKLLQSCLQPQLGPFSVWWTNGSQRIGSQGRIFKGLPAPSCYAELLGDKSPV